MLIRKKVVFAIIALIIALGFAILGGMQMIVIPAVEHIESREASEQVLNAVQVVKYELNTMQGTALDWARWDESYFFAQERGHEYIDNNLVEGTFTTLKLDLMLYYDTNGTLFYGKGYDFNELQPLKIPESLNTNPAGSILNAMPVEPGEENPGVQGVLTLPEGMLLISINPILKSDSTGPITGYLGIARYLDDAEVQNIARLTSTNLTIRKAGDATFSPTAIPVSFGEQERYASVVISRDSDSITSSAMMEDIYGMPGAVFSVTSPRETYKIAQDSVLFFLVIIVGIGCISVLSILYILDQSFLSRLTNLEKRMKEIADSRDFSRRIEVSGDDEITSLSSRIDLTLDALEDHINTERDTVQSARIANEKLTLLSKITSHDILNQVTVIRGFTDLSRESLQPDSPAIPYLDRISEASTSIEDQLAFTWEYQMGGEQSAPVWFNIHDLVQRVVWKMPLGTVKVLINTGELEVFSDPLLEKIIYNLIENAIIHGEKATRIWFSFCEEGDDGVLKCEDDGVGIPYDEKERIFEKGFGKHRGLGLFLSRGILSVTGITIQEKGIPGEGAKFELRIPKGLFRTKRPGGDQAP